MADDIDFGKLEAAFRGVIPAADFCSLRFFRAAEEHLAVRQDIPQPVHRSEDAGAMVTVIDRGGLGYAATSDLSRHGLRQAVRQAADWAARSAGRGVTDFSKVPMPHSTGRYSGPNEKPWASAPLAGKLELLMDLSRRLHAGATIVDWEASLWHRDVDTLLLTSGGGRVEQHLALTGPGLRAVANRGSESQTRTFGGHAMCRQGGLEVPEQMDFAAAPETVAAEAAEFLAAPDCPTGAMDLLLAPDQMVLQIHESIGHPLELDRILGDERNFAGTSFVTSDMFGQYAYGSGLLNVAFDPTVPEQLSSYGFDDEGLKAERVYLIRNGILQRPLGGVTSQARAKLAGTANARCDSWKRPPIDRMANINLEAPEDGPTLEQIIAGVKRGVYMKTNNSWSIDDSRNKFQFGCEWGRLIEDGQLTTVVRNPNYRGISATFWRSLKAVGGRGERLVMGTPNCGKGEPNQIMFVAHASPPCLFGDVEVFGGA